MIILFSAAITSLKSLLFPYIEYQTLICIDSMIVHWRKTVPCRHAIKQNSTSEQQNSSIMQ